MAYFPNGTAGMVFDEQCQKCRYGQEPCPIALVQLTYNYDACNNKVASSILNDMVKDSGDCAMWGLDPDFFGTNGESQPDLLELSVTMGRIK